MYAPLPEQRLLLGLNSGTSADGVDVVLIRVSGFGLDRKVEVVGGKEFPTPVAMKKAICNASSWTIAELAAWHFRVADLHADVALQCLSDLGIESSEVFAVGSHGQTVFHHSGKSEEGSLQIGDIDVIANRLKIPVVGDFRWADIAAGGQGAPISAFADWVLHRATGSARAILNLGGIANITLLNGDEPPLAWDCGPANGPLDALMRRCGSADFDANGSLAASGSCNRDLLTKLQEIEFFMLEPPKSTGLELFGVEFVEEVCKLAPELKLPDQLATLVELAAWAVAAGLESAGWVGGDLFMAGGGVHNSFLVNRIGNNLGSGTALHNYSELGWNADLRESVAFALLADAHLNGEPASWPRSTGSSHPCVLGKLAGASFSNLSGPKS